MSCSKVHLRLVKKFPGHPPAGAIVPSAAPGVAESVIKQAPLAAASRQRPATSIGGGCGGRGGGGGEAAACSLGGDASCDVLVHAPTAANDRSRPAAIALRLFRPLHMDVIMQKTARGPEVGLRQNALGRILYSTHAIAQWRMIDGCHQALMIVADVDYPSDHGVMATEPRFDEGQGHEQS